MMEGVIGGAWVSSFLRLAHVFMISISYANNFVCSSVYMVLHHSTPTIVLKPGKT